jgi:anti-sigma factor RsiW
MMDDCRRTAGRVTPYVDGVLPEGERSDVERHLAACPPCRRGALEEQGGRTVLRECADRLKAEPLPPGLRSRCETLAREHSRVRLVTLWRLLAPITAMAVLIIFAGVLLFSLATRRSDALLAAQLTADHVKCFKIFAPGDEAPADAARVEQELDAKYGWDMHVPASSRDAAITLIGGRRCLYADGSMPHVMYTAGGSAPVSLFRLEGVTRKEGEVTALGHHCRIWSRGGHTYVLVTPERQTPEMVRLAQYVRAEAR